jgi:FkbM family methyltransferase
MDASDPNPTAARGVGRRDLLASGLGGLAGLAAGAVAGRTILAKTPQAAPQPEGLPEGDWRIPPSGKVSYSQFGDDLTTASLFSGLKGLCMSYIDIGASDPVEGNNTYFFYLRGARGVLVEPNVACTELLRTRRPRDTVLTVGIGTDDRAEADYYVMQGAPGLNTFDKEQAERLARETPYKIERVLKLPLVGINRVMAEHFADKPLDFLSIDIEGLDYAVLKTLDFRKYRPKVICAETLITNTNRHNPDTTKLLIENGYEIRGMNLANTFYVDKKLLV